MERRGVGHGPSNGSTRRDGAVHGAAQARHPSPRPQSAIGWTALGEAALLGGTGVMLLAKARAGELVYYIHPRYFWLVVACGIVLLALAVARLRGPARAGRAGGYLLLAIPLVLGALVPARPLGTNALAGDALGVSGSLRAEDSLGSDSRRWNLFEWATAVSAYPEEVAGKPAEVIGFVYHHPQRPLDGFFVVRFVVTCCIADGRPIGLPVVWPGGTTLPPNAWVRVRGTLGRATVGGQTAPALLATAVEPVPQPEAPYIYR